MCVVDLNLGGGGEGVQFGIVGKIEDEFMYMFVFVVKVVFIGVF